MADERKLTRQEVSTLRGRLKAKKRATVMANRHEKRLKTAEDQYQEKLAKDLNNFL
jgi:hypothetical protein